VALANKMVRIAWALLAQGRGYEAQWNDSREDLAHWHPWSGTAFKANSSQRPATSAEVKNESCPTGKTDAGVFRSWYGQQSRHPIWNPACVLHAGPGRL